jgi:hypothetical protein
MKCASQRNLQTISQIPAMSLARSGEASKVFLDYGVPQRRMVGKIGRTSRDYNEGWVVDAVPCIDTKELCCCMGTEAVQTPPLY